LKLIGTPQLIRKHHGEYRCKCDRLDYHVEHYQITGKREKASGSTRGSRLSDSTVSHEQIAGLLGIELAGHDSAYSAELAEFLTDFGRGKSDPAVWSEEVRHVARFAERFFHQGYQAKQAQQSSGLPDTVRAALADAARGFQMLADNPAPDVDPQWLAECRKKADILTTYINSFTSSGGLCAGDIT
jgi:hypothetical protein